MENFRYIGFWKRICIASIDFLIIMLIFWLTTFIEVDYSYGVFPVIMYLFLLLTVIHFTYSIVFYYFFGATPGKILYKAKIIDLETNKRPKLYKLLFRYICYIPSSLVFFYGFLNSAFDSRHQTWHDKIVNTAIISISYPENVNFSPNFVRDRKLFYLNNILIILNTLFIILLCTVYFHEENRNSRNKRSELLIYFFLQNLFQYPS